MRPTDLWRAVTKKEESVMTVELKQARGEASQSSGSSRVPAFVRERMPLYHPDFPVIVFWSQKAGCTTVAKWFFEQIGLLEEALAYGPWVHKYERRVYKNHSNYLPQVINALSKGEHHVLKVVRQPGRRAVSAFLTLGDVRIARLKSKHWANRHWDLVDRWLEEKGKPVEEGLNFLDHLVMLSELRDTAPNLINSHLRPQYIHGEAAAIKEIVTIEGFRDWTAAAPQRFGIMQCDFERISQSRHHRGTDDRETTKLGAHPENYKIQREIFSRSAYPDGDVFVNAVSLPVLKDYYGADFAAYGHLYET